MVMVLGYGLMGYEIMSEGTNKLKFFKIRE
jgi:hypothetical protein